MLTNAIGELANDRLRMTDEAHFRRDGVADLLCQNFDVQELDVLPEQTMHESDFTYRYMYMFDARMMILLTMQHEYRIYISYYLKRGGRP